jgi:uncharacterized protein (TIGR00730 family)
MTEDGRLSPFRDAAEDILGARTIPDSPQSRAPAYRLAYADPDFLLREELRPVRLQLELLKPELAMAERGIKSTVVLFGGSRVPSPETAGRARTAAQAALARHYDEARRFAALVTARSIASGGREHVIVTGGGPGVMEAGNRGAAEAGGISIGLNIVLPHEQAPNAWVTPELCFNFHYFAIRKMHFLLRARAVAIFPGGFGTLDEMFESLTLIQTQRMRRIPVLLFGAAFWRRVIDWQGLEDAGVIDPGDLSLIRFVETAEEALAAIDAHEAGAAGEAAA